MNIQRPKTINEHTPRRVGLYEDNMFQRMPQINLRQNFRIFQYYLVPRDKFCMKNTA